MKKIILITSLIILIAPSVALASWWNPFSWFEFSFFQNTETYKVATSTPTIIEFKSSKIKSDSFNSKREIDNLEKTKEIVPLIKTQMSKEFFNEVCKSGEGGGVNSEWNGVETTSLARRMLCDCKAGYNWSDSQDGPVTCVSEFPKSASVDLYAKYRDPKTGEIMSPNEYVKYWNATCASQNKTRSKTANDDGTVDCITHNQACREGFGSNSKFEDIDSNGLLICGCKNGYTQGADNKSCEKEKKSNYNEYDPYGVFDDGTVYSPQQRMEIECAYYGRNCQYQPPVQIPDTYQYVPVVTPVRTNITSCSNYQTEKANLDRQSANNGTLFSGGRAQKESALKAKYPECN